MNNLPRLFLTDDCDDCIKLRKMLAFDPQKEDSEELRVIMLGGTYNSQLDVLAHYGVADVLDIDFPYLIDDDEIKKGFEECVDYLFSLGLIF